MIQISLTRIRWTRSVPAEVVISRCGYSREKRARNRGEYFAVVLLSNDDCRQTRDAGPRTKESLGHASMHSHRTDCTVRPHRDNTRSRYKRMPGYTDSAPPSVVVYPRNLWIFHFSSPKSTVFCECQITQRKLLTPNFYLENWITEVITF